MFIGLGVDIYFGLFSNCVVSNGFVLLGDLGSNDDYGFFLFGEYEFDLIIFVFLGMNIYIFWEDVWLMLLFDFIIIFIVGVGGCIDLIVLNYNLVAIYDDGSCVFFVYGCIDYMVMNFDVLVNMDDGFCTYCIVLNN